MSGEDADVSWHSVTELDFDDVAGYQLLGREVQFLTVTYHDRELDKQASVFIFPKIFIHKQLTNKYKGRLPERLQAHQADHLSN